MPDGAFFPLPPDENAGARSTPAPPDPWCEHEDGLRAASGIALSTVISAAIWLGLAVAFHLLFHR